MRIFVKFDSMKLDLFLFIFALILAFLTGNMAYFIKNEGQADFKDIKEVRKLHVELQEEITPYKRLDLNIDYPTQENLKLLDPQSIIATKASDIFFSSAECIKSKISQLSSSYINKETLWQAYLCNQVEHLPIDFFDSPPFMHPNGHSYAYMKYKTLNSHFKRLRWLDAHAKSMHITELKKLQWPNSTAQQFLINLPDETFNRIIAGDGTFIARDFYFIKNGPLKYYIVDKDIALRFFKRARYYFSENGKECIFNVANVCWHKRPHNLQSLFSQSAIVIFLGTIIILVLTANSLYNRLRKKKMEEERKKHALRTLTHELRTPIASLLLHMNQIQQNPEAVPSELQEELLKIEGQIYRLKHLAEKSQSYLQTDNTELISLKQKEIPSLKEFCEEFLWEYESEDIHLKVLKDSSLWVDPYWLKMCVMNLIDNALRYGKPPVEIEIDQSGDCIILTIRDFGHMPYLNLKELLNSRHKNSKGLGLGLIIVNKTLKEMGAKLSLSTNPTEFKIKIKKQTRPKDEKNSIS